MTKKKKKSDLKKINKDNDDNGNKTGKNNNSSVLSPDQAAELIRQPYITEKTFNMIERENKLTFIVSDKTNKKNVAESLESLYASDISEVNTLRTVRGKKACNKAWPCVSNLKKEEGGQPP